MAWNFKVYNSEAVYSVKGLCEAVWILQLEISFILNIKKILQSTCMYILKENLRHGSFSKKLLQEYSSIKSNHYLLILSQKPLSWELFRNGSFILQ